MIALTLVSTFVVSAVFAPLNDEVVSFDEFKTYFNKSYTLVLNGTVRVYSNAVDEPWMGGLLTEASPRRNHDSDSTPCSYPDTPPRVDGVWR